MHAALTNKPKHTNISLTLPEVVSVIIYLIPAVPVYLDTCRCFSSENKTIPSKLSSFNLVREKHLESFMCYYIDRQIGLRLLLFSP
jgi:hypothetical protein